MGGGGDVRFLLINGVPQAHDHVPPVASFLQSTQGAYTTTRTLSLGPASSVLFWHRHLARLTHSVRILSQFRPHLLGPGPPPPSPSPHSISSSLHLLNHSLKIGHALASHHRARHGLTLTHELALTALITTNEGPVGLPASFDVLLHIGFYAPLAFGSAGACLAVAGPGRDLPSAKYSDWVRVRRGLEKMRPPDVTELLLTNNGDELLEGTVTNFFVVCKVAARSTAQNRSSNHGIELQTAPVKQGVLPGVVRQLVIEICSEKGIPLREVAPTWSQRNFWEEAFITSSLRIVQHVDSIQAPVAYNDLHLKTWEDVSWVSKDFQGPGHITTLIQKEILARAATEGYQLK